ncbi:MAG: tetratricopeptide repeat protein [Candidatus Zhuqueibacterota bacterium]
MNSLQWKIIVAVCIIIFPLSIFAQDESTQLFYSAKRLMHQRKYDQALESYALLKKNFPDSKYVDDAEFWSAYILEKKEDDKNAFDAYERFAKNNPTSPFVDDAMVYQISVAEKLAWRGDKTYQEFIAIQLNASNQTVKYQASLSLGKLRDSRAIPTLKQMANNGDQDMSLMAKSLIRDIHKPRDQRESVIKTIINPGQEDAKPTDKGATIKRNNVPTQGKIARPPQQSGTTKSTATPTKPQTPKSSTPKVK